MKKNSYTARGFTIIELLLVITIIGLIATLGIASIKTAREQARDSKRLADVNKILQAVELYFLDEISYPVGNNLTLGLDSANSRCLNTGGWQTSGCAQSYQDLLNADPLTPDQDYVYTLISATNFRIDFTLEHGNNKFPAGPCRGLPSVIINCP